MYEATTFEQRAEVYTDVIELLSPGFLTHPVDLGGYNFVFRSLCPAEFDHLTMRVGRHPTDRNYKNWALAMATCMLDGQIFVGDQSCIISLYKEMVDLPNSIVDILFSVFMGLNNRVRKSLKYIEAYSYEDSSRQLWLRIGENFNAVAGYEGIEKVGLNTIQTVWTSYNKYEDIQVANLHYWEGVKLIASASSPKDIQKISEREHREIQEELAIRQEKMDLAYYKFHNYDVGERELELRSEQKGARPIKTVETLEGEFDKWVKGERDFHDEVVYDQKSRIQQKMKDAVEADHKRRAELKSSGGFFVPEGIQEGIVAYTQEQMQALVAQSNNKLYPGTIAIVEDDMNSQLEVYRKHIAREGILPSPGTQIKSEVSLDQQIEARMKSNLS